MTLGPNFKFITAYLVIFYSLAVLGALALHRYRTTHYSKALLEQMITTPSNLRDTTDNPCQYTIYGDPQAAEDQFVKITFTCPNGQITTSTLSLKALPDAKLSTILTEYARILSFDLKLISSWPCTIETTPAPNRNVNVPHKAQVHCYAKN